MFYCDCKLVNGKIKRGKDHLVSVDKHEKCLDCGHYAYYKPPQRYNHEGISKNNKDQAEYESYYHLHDTGDDSKRLF